MATPQIRVNLTPAQIRAVNSALALLEAEVEAGYDVHTTRLSVLTRTRRIVWDAMEKAGVTP